MQNNQKLNVVIVEDEPMISIFIKRVVASMGENVVAVCYDSDSAFQELELHKPNLIFMDINIQGPLDGISVIRKLNLSHKPSIFFVSAYSDNETITDALSTNPYSYLIKPVKEEDIQIAVVLARKEQFKPQEVVSKENLYFSDEIYYDLLRKELMIHNDVSLTNTELKLVDFFVSKIGLNISILEFKNVIWGDKEVSDSTVRDVISKLRKKIPEIPIETNFGRGYILHFV